MAKFNLIDLSVFTIKVLPKTPRRAKIYERDVIYLKKITRWKQMKSISYTARVKSLLRDKITINKKTKPAIYDLTIRFFNVEANEKPSLMKHPVRIKCTCPAFHFWFGFPDWLYGVLEGKPNKWNKIPSRKRNPKFIVGMCKHLLAFSRMLIARKHITI